jgi:hypothetical protein
MFLYLVDYWVPFPASEQGGLIAVIAETSEEVFDILSNDDRFDSRYSDRIMERVLHAQRFLLADGEYESGVVEQFTT